MASPAAVSTAVNNTTNAPYITEDQAKAIARENAGYAETDVQFVWVELTESTAGAEYKVEFLSGTKEYDYHIDAATGEIMSMAVSYTHLDVYKRQNQ